MDCTSAAAIGTPEEQQQGAGAAAPSPRGGSSGGGRRRLKAPKPSEAATEVPRARQLTYAWPPTTYPDPQPHPSTRAYDIDFGASINAVCPIGLLVESIAWHGMAIDKNFKVWQEKETAIDILHMPYQHLKQHILMAAAGSRTRAEWIRQIRPEVRIKEIDKKASNISEKTR